MPASKDICQGYGFRIGTQFYVPFPDLFHRAIMMSGSAYADWAMVEDPVHFAVKLASSLNCTIPRYLGSLSMVEFLFHPLIKMRSRNMLKDHEDILKCLRGRNVDDLTKFKFETPSFLTAMGPSRDGVLIPADFGIDNNNIRKRAHSSTYQVDSSVFVSVFCHLSRGR